MSNSKEILFIGGVWDGHIIGVDDSVNDVGAPIGHSFGSSLLNPVSDIRPSLVEVEKYRRKRITDTDGSIFEVMISDRDINGAGLISRLFEFYKVVVDEKEDTCI